MNIHPADLCIYILGWRYHYNVADIRLPQHIEKGNDDGLFISSVASCSNLWAVIMDAGTGCTAQVYQLSPSFLHKVALSFIYSKFVHCCCHFFTFLLLVVGMDYGTMGKKLLHHSSSWSKQWKLICGYVQG